ncbi:MAG: CBS domain-containing protein, partial [Gammaproteobacteria bacterium]|nr:CBS domain-containing protein [Gammaproteobacteria bacterium]
MKNWTEILLKPTDSLETTIKVLHAGGMRIALVVDDNKRLLGTVTDGDIRRALLRHLDMSAQATEFLQSDPTTASVTDHRDAILAMMKSRGILAIPLLDAEDRVAGMETLQRLVSGEKFNNLVFLMAGGFGTRLRPLTEEIPKPLLKVGGKPILETILTQFVESGFHNFYISTHYKAEMVREHFGDGRKWGVNIRYVHE